MKLVALFSLWSSSLSSSKVAVAFDIDLHNTS